MSSPDEFYRLDKYADEKPEAGGEPRSEALETAWKRYLQVYPYSLTELRDPWVAFEWAWKAAWDEAAKMVDGN